MIGDWEALRAQFDGAPYSRLLDMRVVTLGPGYSKIGMTIPRSGSDRSGRVHQGVIMSLADQAFGTATNTLDPRYHYVAVQFSITFVGEATAGECLIAEGNVVYMEEGRGSTDILVHGADGRLVARASGAVLAIPK